MASALTVLCFHRLDTVTAKETEITDEIATTTDGETAP